ncbi:MAG TPA: GIDE domain-containing protein, partial [Desulfosalsimonadaceae bacterium]|nr:GIDE domain-containing protein [Desulfosalsimonadaceae bacterium]
YSLLLLYYKRMAENTPTSKVRSLSMGFAELAGRARPYYDLRTAYTLTRCVYYECSYYKYQRTGDTSRWRLSSTLSSGKLAFYLEDETGQVLINPEGAYYAIKRARQTMRGRFIPSLAIKLDDPYTKVTEDLIPLGAQIYVLGSAHTKRRGRQHQERLVDRLRELKRDQSRMARYDSNRDGHIDSQEWDAARADMERQIYAESLAGQKKPEETVVVEKPKFGLLPFIVADSEDGLLRKFAIRSWVFLACGAVAFACGIGILI